MPRRFQEPRLVLASHNPGKLAELRELLAPHVVAVTSSEELGLPEPVEDGETFVANARLKARHAVQATRLPALADDSGLAVHGLDGAPGVHSARWGGPERDFGVAMARVQEGLRRRYDSLEAADRRATFVAVLCLAWADGHEELAEGRVEGTLIDAPRGGGGFGYDPWFVPVGHERTFAEMAPADKRALSHRTRALRQLLATCFGP